MGSQVAFTCERNASIIYYLPLLSGCQTRFSLLQPCFLVGIRRSVVIGTVLLHVLVLNDRLLLKGSLSSLSQHSSMFTDVRVGMCVFLLLTTRVLILLLLLPLLLFCGCLLLLSSLLKEHLCTSGIPLYFLLLFSLLLFLCVSRCFPCKEVLL